ncbi:helix-turn-helix transcriptional regulator [Nitrogeniibacter aestuarii]|uniref:helix-turn-helix transcriptional regulator n=1 Tax=Nitrogeniibacter aestuarii TaxID=2815343 RepID=UPI001D1085C2
MKLRDVIQVTSLSRSTIYRRMADGSFPNAIRIGTNRIAWRQEDLSAWLADCIAPSNVTTGDAPCLRKLRTQVSTGCCASRS